ncbi:hypothetical protein G7Y89_g14264 [Cudoniella acicularis]|uniref:Uncharacterized protein n=1 Tax=Cudoniella acicularis TaxID=354080 RepID=A0A8H4R5W4_9HELO|nr:hypothetical protein G7Y89_g14264 [Cudoniella acicularis]
MAIILSSISQCTKSPARNNLESSHTKNPTVKQPGPSLLRRCPAEVRLVIFQHLLESTWLSKTNSNSSPEGTKWKKSTPPILAALRGSSGNADMYAEALEAFFKTNPFLFESPQCFKQMSESLRSQIRILQVQATGAFPHTSPYSDSTLTFLKGLQPSHFHTIIFPHLELFLKYGPIFYEKEYIRFARLVSIIDHRARSGRSKLRTIKFMTKHDLLSDEIDLEKTIETFSRTLKTVARLERVSSLGNSDLEWFWNEGGLRLVPKR